jgi:hypothetical protein
MMELGCKEQVHNHLMYATSIQILPLISTNYQIKVFSRLLCKREREESHANVLHSELEAILQPNKDQHLPSQCKIEPCFLCHPQCYPIAPQQQPWSDPVDR